MMAVLLFDLVEGRLKSGPRCSARRSGLRIRDTAELLLQSKPKCRVRAGKDIIERQGDDRDDSD